jgi:exosortase family protein XrtF
LKKIFTEHKAAVFFLLRFLIVFGGLSLAYGYWIKSFGDRPDSFSWLVGKHLGFFLKGLQLEEIPGTAAISVIYGGNAQVSLFEGCNGIAVMILFFAFIFAFKGKYKDLLWYAPLGFLVIHLFNLFRLALLILLARAESELFHYMHKYILSLIIYSAVFLLWLGWVRLVKKRRENEEAVR